MEHAGGRHDLRSLAGSRTNASSPVNGPSDSQASISIPLAPGKRYRYYIFGQPGDSTFEYGGLNLFFDGNNSTPRISVFAPLDSLTFYPNSSSTINLQSTPVTGSKSSRLLNLELTK